jgi:HSP20 family molecular chaperone IbpA
MSIARQFLREFRPLIRVLEEPFSRSPSYFNAHPARSLFDDPFFGFQSPNALRPPVDVTEEGNSYIVEAELPGVKKENLEVRIGDGGRSVTIEGKIMGRAAGTETAHPEKQLEEGASETPDAASSMSVSPFKKGIVLTRVVRFDRSQRPNFEPDFLRARHY